MSIESTVKAHLAADAAVSALVNERIYPILRPSGDPSPAVTYQSIGVMPQQSLDGFVSQLTRVRLQIDIWALSADSAHAVRDAVQLRMLTRTTNFNATLQEPGWIDLYEAESRVFHVSGDFLCWFRG